MALECLGHGPNDPFGMRVFDGLFAHSGGTVSHATQPFGPVDLGDPTQHGVDESGGLRCIGLDHGDGLRQCRMVGHAHGQDLVGAEAHSGQRFGVDAVDGPVRGPGDDRIVELLLAQGAVRQFRCERRVLGFHVRAGQLGGQEQVRVGVLRLYVDEDLPGDAPRQVLRLSGLTLRLLSARSRLPAGSTCFPA